MARVLALARPLAAQGARSQALFELAHRRALVPFTCAAAGGSARFRCSGSRPVCRRPSARCAGGGRVPPAPGAAGGCELPPTGAHRGRSMSSPASAPRSDAAKPSRLRAVLQGTGAAPPAPRAGCRGAAAPRGLSLRSGAGRALGAVGSLLHIPRVPRGYWEERWPELQMEAARVGAAGAPRARARALTPLLPPRAEVGTCAAPALRSARAPPPR